MSAAMRAITQFIPALLFLVFSCPRGFGGQNFLPKFIN